MVEGEAFEHPLVPPSEGLAGLATRLLQELHIPVLEVLPPLLEVFQTDIELLCLHLPRIPLPLVVLGGSQPQVAVVPQPLHQRILGYVRETPPSLFARLTTLLGRPHLLRIR